MKAVDPLEIVHIPIDESCVVQAGPGSGKTWLLVERIKFLMVQELRPHSTIACITYTNAAADEISERLPAGVELGFLGTIHSFLLSFVVYPYGHLLEELGKDFELVTEGYAKQYLSWMVQQGHLPQQKAYVPDVVSAFEAIGYNLEGELQDFTHKGLKPDEMRAFVDRRLSKGHISQQDVLWFSFRILTDAKYAHILDALSCRFASILVDEFQDTTELQYGVLERLHSLGRTSLFLVGDPDQSIFSFAGAKVETFQQIVAKYSGYELIYNRRSATNIVNFLDNFRTSSHKLEPVADWKDLPIPVYVLVGKASNAERIERFRELLHQHRLSDDEGNADYFVLARGLALTRELSRLEAGGVQGADQLLATLHDKHPQLYAILKALMQACKYRQMEKFSHAHKCLDHALSLLILKKSAPFGDPTQVRLSRDDWRLMVTSMLHRLDVSSDVDTREWVNEFRSILADCLYAVSGKKQGNKLVLLNSVEKQLKKKTQYPIRSAMHAVALPDEIESNVRTIHGAKGAQRDAVLIVASTPQQFTIWLKRCVNGAERKEDSRIGYVAFSRAMKLLCVAVDSLSSNSRQWLRQMPYVTILDIADAKGNPLLL
jgi:DNA helicase-2/ATP-dependent DNA helicase PcrA